MQQFQDRVPQIRCRTPQLSRRMHPRERPCVPLEEGPPPLASQLESNGPLVRIQECTGYAPHGVCRCWGRRAPAPAPPGTLRIPGEPVNVPYRILNPGACMMCIGGVAASETSDACTACLEPRCTRWKEGAQERCATEGRRVPKTEGDASPRGKKIGLQCWATRTGKTPCDDPRARPGGMQPAGRSRRRPGGLRGAPEATVRARSGSLRP